MVRKHLPQQRGLGALARAREHQRGKKAYDLLDASGNFSFESDA
jgi:hypothetical protein